MLYKNDELVKITEKEIKELKKLVGKFPVVFKLNKQLYSVNPLNPNRTERPGGVIIPFEERVDDKHEGSVKWNYCELPPSKEDGNMVYYKNSTSGMIVTSTKFTVTETKIDLLYFLVYVSKVVKVVGASPYTTSPLFVMENTHLEAVERNKDREEKAEVYGAIYGSQRMGIAEVVRLAKAFRVPMADSLSDDEVRDALFNSVEAMQQDKRLKNGYKTFLELADNKTRTEALSLIQKGKDMKRIAYLQKEAKWYLLDENGKKTQVICSLISGRTPDESLEQKVTTDEEVFKLVKQGIPEDVLEESEAK